jgi:hypothetical protein
MPSIYCGNNGNAPGLLSGRETLGTRYDCLRKGIGVGRKLPYNPDNYANAFARLDPRIPYCGNSANLPNGYNHMGSLRECYESGIGVGMAQRAQQGYIFVGSPIFFNLLFLGLFALFFILSYIYKPFFVIKEGKENKEIDWEKFIANSVAVALVLLIIRYFIKTT